ncbi:hypothetical protein FB451DRAFT_779035 [Mycena latifolia]|nr:hypothetical protein FB451DRAFT_779035 [Mycena latifolia]
MNAANRMETVMRRVRTFNARHLGHKDFMDIPATARLRLSLPGQHPLDLVPAFTFQRADLLYTGPGARLRGFLYYHLEYPRHFLSGGLRFRCCEHNTLHSFAHGHDLPDRAGLPWDMSLDRLVPPRYAQIQRRLVADGFLTDAQLAIARKLISSNPAREEHPPPFVHALGQPFVLDLARTARLRILSPHGVLRPTLFPRLAHSGAALVRFERPEHADEGVLYLRVLRVLAPAAYLPRWAHLPPLAEGALCPTPLDPARPWTWTYDDKHPQTSAALHCLFHPPEHFPPPGEVLERDAPVVQEEYGMYSR